MEPNIQTNICSVCHQPILSTYYFCPNCGAGVHTPPLDTSTAAQIKLYGFSILLPFIAFLFVGKWQGIKYYKSEDPQTHQMGQIAWLLIMFSTIFLIWISVKATNAMIDSALQSINTDFGGL